jgi:hypothetical protein
MQRLASEYTFGRGAKVPTRGQTRYLFMMVAVDLVKDFLINNQLDYSRSSISNAVIKLSANGHLKQIGDAAVQLIDDYLTNGNEDSLFMEPEFQKMQDLNAFLKSERLGKGDEHSPRLRTQMAMTKKIFRKSAPLTAMKAAVTAEELN